MASFDTLTIEEATERLIDYRGKTPPKSDSGVRLVTAKVVKGGRIHDEPAEFIAADFYDEWMRRGLPQKLDVLLTTEAPLGEVAILRDDARVALAQRIILLRAKRGLLDPVYLFYALQSEFGQGELKARASGTTVLGIKQSELRKVRVPVFPLPIQRRIAGILSAYDELIENSQRRIKILETMARGLYRKWFVHFRFPGHEHHPHVPSPLGEIPKGWEVKKLGTLADISWGDTSTTKAAYVEEGYAAYSASGLDGKLDHYDFDRLGIVLSAIGAQCGKTWLARGKWSCIKNTIRFWSKNECVSTEFLFIATLGQDFWPRRGAAQPFISQGDAERIDVLIPDPGTMNSFTIFAAVSLKHIAMLDSQIQNLRRTRDLLLLRLLSGQIDVEAIAS